MVTTNLRCIFGTFWDIERMVSGVTKSVTYLSRKPQSLPQLMVVGDTYAYTPAYPKPQSLLIVQKTRCRSVFSG